MVTGAAAGAIGSVLGNALVAPLSNQYMGHVRPKPVVGDDDDVFKTHPIGVSAADDIIGNYKTKDDSYAGKLNHFRELHDAEMQKRREALNLMPDKPKALKDWCKTHINILFPTPPVSDVLNRYANAVRAYDSEKHDWDTSCGGPSTMPGYSSFTDELAGLKPDAAPGAGTYAGVTRKAPTYDAAPRGATENTAPPAETAKASGKASSDAEDELLPTPKTAKGGDVTDAPPAAQQSTPPAAGAASDAAPSPDDSANTNHATEFFGQKNAQVTEKDLADTRAPDLTSPQRGGATGATAGGAAGGTASVGSTPALLSQGEPLRILPSGPPHAAFMPSEYGFEGRGGYDKRYDQVWGKETAADNFIAKWNFIEPLTTMQGKLRGWVAEKATEKAKEQVSPTGLRENAEKAVAWFLDRIRGGKGIASRIEDTADGRNAVQDYALGVKDRALKNINDAIGSEDQQADALNALDDETKKRDDLQNEANRVWMGQVKDPMDLQGLTKEQFMQKYSPFMTKQASIREKPVCYLGDNSLGISCGRKIVYSPPR
jgi:hypothetical protein